MANVTEAIPSGRGAHLLASRGIHPLKIQSFGRWKSDLVVHYAGEALAVNVAADLRGGCVPVRDYALFEARFDGMVARIAALEEALVQSNTDPPGRLTPASRRQERLPLPLKHRSMSVEVSPIQRYAIQPPAPTDMVSMSSLGFAQAEIQTTIPTRHPPAHVARKLLASAGIRR